MYYECMNVILFCFCLNSVLNYDPRLRYKVANMMLTFLLPPHISTTAAHKFYALLESELNELYDVGIAKGKLKGMFRVRVSSESYGEG